MLDFLWVDSFFGNFTIETFPFLENNVTFSAKHYTFWKLCSHWLEFSKNSPSITCFLFSKNNITSVSTTFDSSLTTLGNGIYSAEQQPSLLSFFHIIHCSDQHQRPVEWSLRVRCNPTYHSVAHIISLTHIIRDRFQSRKISLELTQWVTKLLWSVGITALTLTEQIFPTTRSRQLVIYKNLVPNLEHFPRSIWDSTRWREFIKNWLFWSITSTHFL